jgi:outer membrane protein TolC
MDCADARLDAVHQVEADVAQVVRTVAASVKVGQARKSDEDRARSRALLINGRKWRRRMLPSRCLKHA